MGKCKKNGPRQFLRGKNEGSEYIMCLGFLKYVVYDSAAPFQKSCKLDNFWANGDQKGSDFFRVV